jgi:hyperosmotically inducible periplasmic protein
MKSTLKPTATHRSFHRLALLSLVAGTVALAACSKEEEEPTVGQKIDSTISQAEQKAAEAKSSMEDTAKEARAGMESATDTMTMAVKDAAITTAVKAELARDSSVSALDINVDTEAGRVVLRGSAPDAAARDRAYSLASAVDGVVAVNNELVIKPS